MTPLGIDPRLPSGGDRQLAVRLYELFTQIVTRLNWLLDGGVKVVTTTEKSALTVWQGRMVFDSDLGKLCVYTGAAWQTVTSS